MKDLAAQVDDVLGSPARVVPVPRVDEDADAGTACLRERSAVGQAPDELVRSLATAMQRTERLHGLHAGLGGHGSERPQGREVFPESLLVAPKLDGERHASCQ